ncbi:thiamine-phosphate pyrophosphorylase [Caloranaerobacter azorensis DSM 13643]|uniref:Thiamine-phosphate synthase n=1 Tax=Caloranaerobacter azorensis DSM 13643 TaxID=1121264 RepID=A0A1M5U4D5_9FIRM|nr:thiamine phosphate synthase [Caloranaerobacter azorensis]SHH57829.1 thiamine-phosphate pyrophosphorylase [Caloranaerobacter azorensis DSM 13643]
MLYLITNRKIIKKDSFIKVIEDAVKGGVDVVILREKDLSYNELLPTAVKLKNILDGYNIPLIVNGNLDVAKNIKASGFHTSFDRFIKEKIEFKGLLGVSVHSLEEAMISEEYEANYILASHIFETECKKGLKPKGIKMIEEIKRNVKIPVIALGGINHENIDKVLSAGADGIAVMSYIMASEEPFLSAKKLKMKINEFLSKK